jgi:Fe-Mn family superoxide dismutase
MFELPDLPYDHAALEPVISRATMHLHHEKHHQTYFDTTNKLLAEAGRTPASLEEVVREVAALKTRFVEEGATHFGSGWVWLAAEGETIKVISTHDGDDLLTHSGLIPLIVCDLWEHAYYLDHKNDRKAFLTAWFDSLPNWALADRQYAAARGEAEPWKHPAPVARDQGTATLKVR